MIVFLCLIAALVFAAVSGSIVAVIRDGYSARPERADYDSRQPHR
ncbi:hypothetical protein FHX49_000539 [Microbacterium endophyticum]|uniref:Uncharacterized protein n=1 Tax=Microbacterium endophyticum TaxID=1526412 RepID=A0A7W4V186_9MICO|nr:hypothetical protein [Microbacterium endophyticum]MBB2974998.1 hypothetical protein [Microbacterium endophyticum]NIK37462.1 hypothetical protein [Microbacterium endophyticum]